MKSTLKKFLSITLVVSMLMSMCTFVFAITPTPTDSSVQIEGGAKPVYYTWDKDSNAFGETSDTNAVVKNSETDTKVTVSKTIAPTDTENEFDITLKVETNQKIEKTEKAPDAAVVLVFDISSSMKNGMGGGKTRIEAAISAAQTFVNKFAGDLSSGERWISIVTFDGKAYDYSEGWKQITNDTDKNEVLRLIGNITCPSRGTNPDDGLKMAEARLADLSTYARKAIDNRFVVLLTDGEPYSCNEKAPGEAYSYPAGYDGKYKSGSQTKWYDSYDAHSKGKGSYSSPALRAGKIQESALFYSISLSAGDKANSWLKDISNGFASATDKEGVEGLVKAFTKIAEMIKLAVNAWTVTDSMGDYIICKDLVLAEGETHAGVTKTADKLTWDLRTDVLNATFKDKDGKEIDFANYEAYENYEGDLTITYELTYCAKLDVAKIVADAAKPGATVSVQNGETNFVKANKETTLEYSLTTEKDGETVFIKDNGEPVGENESPLLTLDFKVPAVKGYKADLSFVKQGYQAKADNTKKTMQPLAGAKFKLANGTVWSAEDNSEADGKIEFTGIPSGASYTLTEETAPAGFDPVAPMSFTVSYGVLSGDLKASGEEVTDPVHVNKISVPITKKWVAPANEIPGTITVTLLCNGEEISNAYTNVVIGPNAANKVTVDENGLWHYTFTDLPETDDDGNLYTYTVVEAAPDGFSETYGSDGLSITNTITGTTTVKVVKNWILPEGFTGTVPDVTVTLTADGEPTTNTAKLGNGGSKEFTVDKYNNGTPIEYSVTEADGSYQWVSTVPSVDENGIQTFTITNTLAQETTPKSGQKIWCDDNDASARQEVTVELLKDGEKIGKTATASAPEWTYKFDNLDKYEFTKNDKGVITGVREIVYTVDEITDVEGYTSEASGMDVTNTRVGTTEFTVKKVWEDVPGATHGKVTVTLRANGTPLTGDEYTRSFEDYYTFQKLDKYDNMGKVIVYDVVETPVKGYTTRYTPNPVTAGTYEQTVINTRVIGDDDKVTLSIEKQWKQPADYAAQAIFTVTGTVSSDCPEAEKAVITDKTQSITGNDTITPYYPKYYEYYDEETGETTFYEYTYTVEEDPISGYTTTGGAVADAANTWKFVNTITGSTTVTVKKNWVKPDDVAKVDVTFNVYQNASETPYTTITITADDADAAESVSVPKYDGNGQIITYSVKEIEPTGFSASTPVQTTKGVWEFTVTNTVNQATKDITVSKTWLDDSRAAADRPDVTLNLSNAGSVTFHYDEATAKVMAIVGEESYEADVSDDGNTYSYKFTGMNVYNEAMTGYVTYTLTEPGYPEGYTGAVSDMVATNRRIGTASIPVTKIWTDPVGSERPDITLVLTGNEKTYEVVFSKDADSGIVTATLGDEVLGTVSGSSWTVNVPVPKYDAMGKEIDYTLTEKSVPGYTQRTVEGQKFMIENVIEQDYVDISAVKVWDNMVEEGEDVVYPAKYPEAITVALYRDNIQVADTERTAERDDETGEYVIKPYTELDKYNLQTGAVYTYTIKETSNGSTVEDGRTVSFGADNNYVVTYSTDNDGNIVIKNTYQVPAKYLYDVTCYYYHYDWTGKQTSFHQTVSDMMTETVKDTKVVVVPETFEICEADHLTYNFDKDNDGNKLEVVLEEENHLYHLYIYYVLTDPTPYYPPVRPKPPVTPPEDIDEPDVPLAGDPEIEDLGDGDVPLAGAPDDEFEELEEEEVPLAAVPKTSDFALLWLASSALSGIGLGALNLKKREDEDEQ